MCDQILISVAMVFAILTTSSCSSLEKVLYRPDLEQGNYLTQPDIANIQKGMTQQQVSYTLGTPALQDPFDTQTWFYIFRKQHGRESIIQQTLTLSFDSKGILTDIQYEKLG